MSNRMNLDANQNLLSIPSDGFGGKCTFRAATTPADTTFTPTTIADANGAPWAALGFGGHAAGTFAAITAGDLVVTSDGFWAIVDSKTAPGTVTIRRKESHPNKPVHCWRHQTNPALDDTAPAAGSTAAIFSPSLLQGLRANRASAWIDKVIINLLPAADVTFDLLYPSGTKIIPTSTVRSPAAGAAWPSELNFGDGLPVRGPFALRANATTLNLCLLFREAQ